MQLLEHEVGRPCRQLDASSNSLSCSISEFHISCISECCQLESKTKTMKVSKAKNSVLLFTIFFVSAYGARTNSFLEKDQDGGPGLAMSPASGDSICKSLVEINGYSCEEHTVK